MSFLCPAKLRRSKRPKGRKHDAPLPGRITGSASIDTLVRVEYEKDLQHKTPMIVLHDFEPCIDDEIAVQKGDYVMMLYKETDWAYVIRSDLNEGFIPSVYCAPLGMDSNFVNNDPPPMPPKKNNLEYNNQQVMEPLMLSDQCIPEADTTSTQSNSLLNISNPIPFTKMTCGRYIVLFGYEGQQEDDISVSRGHFVTLLNQDDPDWYWIQRADGEEGFVPSTYLCPAEGQSDLGNSSLGIYTGQASISKLPTMSTVNTMPIASPSPLMTSSMSNSSDYTQQKQQQQRQDNWPSMDWPYNLNSTRDNPITNGKHIKLQCMSDYSGRVPDDLTVVKGEYLYADLKTQPAHNWLWSYSMVAKRFGYIPRSVAKPVANNHAATKDINLELTQNCHPLLS